MRTIIEITPISVRRTVLTVLGVVLMALVALGVSLTGIAQADPKTDSDSVLAPETAIDVDSLYLAKTSEESQDTSSLEALEPSSEFQGHVSWYGPGFHGRLTANGERFDQNKMTAAHKKLPFNTLVRVIDQRTGKAVLVRINDRGPYIRGRVLDLSAGAAKALGMAGRGTTSGKMEIYEAERVERTVRMTATADQDISIISFDREVRGVRPTGWTVNVAEVDSFDEAAKLHRELGETYQEVFLTQIMVDGEVHYRVAVGLFDSENLSRNLLVELGERFENLSVTEFEAGFPVDLAPSQQTMSAS